MPLDSPSQPPLHFRLYPAHGSRSDPHTARKPAFGFELVDHRASQASGFADLRQTQDLYARHWRAGIVGHVFDSDVWLPRHAGELSPE
jgi:hypothetical protein